ncbi:glycosyltransferase [Corticibacter populi]|nr:glycosyltransferase [Corticibacter populi]RZS30703.1 glycosyltransferase involved in cell wall biosynthesis [Corticibacter populi]
MLPDLNACCLIIPAYNPGDGLVALVGELRARGFAHLVVINDGSAAECAPVFDAIRGDVELLEHAHNQGKGAALKTAFGAVLHRGFRYVITLDADGQHLPFDVQVLAQQALACDDGAVLLGARSFRADAPLRSRIGNELTRWVFGKLSGRHISDTQTGLRLLPASLLPALLRLQGERYEYEMNMLAYLVKHRVPVREVPIATVYIDGNESSHFSPVIDSIRIYWVLLKDLLVAGTSFVLDLALFAALLHATGNIFVAVVVARLLSAVYNFAGNRFFVFRGRHAHALLPQFAGYAALAVLLMLSSATLVEFVVETWRTQPVVTKAAVDGLLYAASFLIRKAWLFRVREDERE